MHSCTIRSESELNWKLTVWHSGESDLRNWQKSCFSKRLVKPRMKPGLLDGYLIKSLRCQFAHANRNYWPLQQQVNVDGVNNMNEMRFSFFMCISTSYLHIGSISAISALWDFPFNERMRDEHIQHIQHEPKYIVYICSPQYAYIFTMHSSHVHMHAYCI